MSVPKDLLTALEWYEKVKAHFKPFKPDITHVSINYREQTCEVKQHIYVPNDVRRRYNKVKIPNYPGFRIKDIMSSTFEFVNDSFALVDGEWQFSADKLPKSEQYLVTLEGALNKKILDEIVRVQPAKNRDQTEEFDRYWLDVMIRDADIWERVWNFLEIHNVEVKVNVALERAFTAYYPEDLKQRIRATQKFLSVGRTINREEMNRAWLEYRKSVRVPILSEGIFDVSKQLLEPSVFPQYLEVDFPFTIGRVIDDATGLDKRLPDRIQVTALTALDYKRRASTGYLTFKKKNFIDVIRDSLGSILENR